MKLRAIRVRDCGRLVAPVALEGLADGLNVLVAPNETGKSTLFRALNAALFERHRTTGRKVESLRPYQGGAPLIEVDLELDRTVWRVRKRFLSERMAEVCSLDGRERARGADAEALIERLLGAGAAGGRAPLLWLEQGSVLEPEPPDETGELLVRRAIEREVSETAGGGALREVARRAEEALEALVQPQRGQPRGRYLVAIEAQRRAAEEAAVLDRALGDAEGLLDRLAGVSMRLDAVSGSAARQALSQRHSVAEAAQRAAIADRAELDRARTRLAEARAADGAAQRLATDLRAAITELTTLDAAAVRDAGEAEALRAAATTADHALIAARAEVETLRRRLAELQAAEQARRVAEQRDELLARHDAARVAAVRLAALATERAGHERLAAEAREARTLAERIATGEARLEAAAAAVTIAYLPSPRGRVRHDGAALDDGARIVADRPLVLEIEGIGRLTIEPGASADRARLAASVAGDRRALAGLLARAGHADAAALEAAAERAQAAARDAAGLEARLSALAPKGLCQLEQALAAAEREAAALSGSEQAHTAGDAAAGQAQLAAELARAETGQRQAEAVAGDLAKRRAALEARAAERDRRRHGLAASLPPPEERARHLAEAESAAAVACRALDDALRIERATTERAPDEARLAALEAEVRAARAAIDQAAREETQLVAAQGEMQGTLAALRQDDLAARQAAALGELERTSAVVADIEEEVAALRLLVAEATAEQARLGDRYSTPVIARLAPYLATVLPDAALALDARYQVAGLARQGREEALERLSDGTREQIAVLVRLAFARLLADRGMAVPLILDDPLVYADDTRIAAMHRVLESAAEAHQVIVLTCREKAFADLRGTRVTLVPWDPAGG